MRIRTISTAQIRRMGDQEGLILQGCGGDPQEWVDGINEILAKEQYLTFSKTMLSVQGLSDPGLQAHSPHGAEVCPRQAVWGAAHRQL